MGNYRPKVFVTSDTHFGHRKMVAEGIRPFATIEEHDAEIVRRWNETVDPRDIVYHLGDVVINRRALATCRHLNGRMRLVKGNHDNFRLGEYLLHFEDVLGVVQYSRCILTHVPVHPNQLHRFAGNVHGHMHDKYVTHESGAPDLRYRCVSLEQTDYRPILLDAVVHELEDRRP